VGEKLVGRKENARASLLPSPGHPFHCTNPFCVCICGRVKGEVVLQSSSLSRKHLATLTTRFLSD